MIYCINPNCSNRLNSDDLETCQACGTKLFINERYQIVKPLRIGQAYNSEVFEVKDFNNQGTVKVLKSLVVKQNSTKVAELFEKEALVLSWLTKWQNHPGIPKVKPDEYFVFGIGNGFRKLQCLVMEKIEGQNLEEWLEQNQPISQEQSLNWLQQLVEILDIVHGQKLWHRDIKPSNIMLKPDGQLVLIDFGAVGVGETRIVSAEYTPQEQIEGKTVLQSDFFALGRTFVYLLTGKHPSELPRDWQTEQLIWRSLAPTISNNLAQLLDDLMAPTPGDRPQTTQEILQRLQSISNSGNTQEAAHRTTTLIKSRTPKKTPISRNSTNQQRRFLIKVVWLGGAMLLLGLAGTLIYQGLPCQVLGNFKPCLAASGDKLSIGEKLLSPNALIQEKKRGVEAFQAGDYDKAVSLFEKARNKQRSDPETLIYLNNARINANKIQASTIAVAVPLTTSSEGLKSGLEILRGVAQAQDEFNRRQNRSGIKVFIADDGNSPAQAKQIAETIVNQESVLAVVGHFTSDSTLKAARVYQQNQLVFVSPTSTSEDLSTQGKSYRPNFFFRTVPSDRVTAQTLADYLRKQANQQTVAVFYNPKSRYSDSLRKQFRDSFSQNGGRIVEEFDLSEIASLEQAIVQAEKQGAKVLALFPDTQNIILDTATTLINTNQCRYPIVGGDTLYNPGILKVGRSAADCLVIAVPWHSTHSSNKEFAQAAQTLWGGQVSWRTALAYDATRSLIEAITQRQQTGKTVQQVLADPNFRATGATGVIGFQANGDRKETNMQLVKVVLDKQGKPMFAPIDKTP